MVSIVLVYITTSDEKESAFLGKKMVKERLAACANIISSMKSFYWWQGKLEEDQESILILKTIDNNLDTIIKRIKELHSYENPCIISWNILKGSEQYLNWIEEELAQQKQ